MAIYFTLRDKTTLGVVSPDHVDELICKEVLNVPVHPRQYGGDPNLKGSFNWFDTIGFQFANGKTLQDGPNSVRRHYQTSDMWYDELPVLEKIIDFLQSRYVVS